MIQSIRALTSYFTVFLVVFYPNNYIYILLCVSCHPNCIQQVVFPHDIMFVFHQNAVTWLFKQFLLNSCRAKTTPILLFIVQFTLIKAFQFLLYIWNGFLSDTIQCSHRVSCVFPPYFCSLPCFFPTVHCSSRQKTPVPRSSLIFRLLIPPLIASVGVQLCP